jgi:transcriptional regulator with XRE-family HTH domain
MQLSKYIEKNEMTVAQAARDFGVIDQTMRHWATGRRTPRAKFMRKIMAWSRGYVTPLDFLDGEHDDTE